MGFTIYNICELKGCEQLSQCREHNKKLLRISYYYDSINSYLLSTAIYIYRFPVDSIMCEYYLDYYTGSISKIKLYSLFLSINYNFRLLEKFIYFYYKVIVVKKGLTPCLSTSDGSCLRSYSS